MRLRLGLLGVALATLTGGLLIATTTPAGANVEFSVIQHNTNFEAAIGGAAASPNPPQKAPAPGDRFIIRDDLLQGSTNIGYDNIVCTVTFNDNLLCDALFAIINKGDIHGTALLRGGAAANGPSVFDGAIDGGTFAYRNAHGDVHIVSLPNGDSQLNFNFVTQ
jgi:hypothetical protein